MTANDPNAPQPPGPDPSAGGPAGAPPGPPPALPLEQEDCIWAMAAHISGPASVVVSAGMLPFLAPLIIWLIKKDDNAFVAEEAKEALNFQITIFVATMVGALVSLLTCGLGLVVFVPFVIIVAVASFVLGILAGIQAYGGKPYRYPYTWRPIS